MVSIEESCKFYSAFSRFVLVTALQTILTQCISFELLTNTPHGFNSEFNIPVRYVHLAATDHGIRLEKPVGDVDFKISASDGSNDKPRYRKQVLDVGDGSYFLRWRLYSSMWKPSALKVTINGTQVFSKEIEGEWMADEDCFCPSVRNEIFVEALDCPSSFAQLEFDMRSFPVVEIERLGIEVPERFNRSHSMIHYTIVSQKLYRKQYGKHGDFKMFSDAMFLSLLRKVRIPDTEFVMNLGDWPGEKRKSERNPIPILTWGGSNDTRDISLPTWDISKKTYSMLKQEIQDVHVVFAHNGKTPWESKKEKGFFRGRDSRKERLELVRLSKKYPEDIDAGLTNYFFFRNGEKEELGKADYVPFTKFFDYKYQINMDGTVAAYRLPMLLAGGSVVFKHDSNYYENFYRELVPWKHFIPFKLDLSDLREKIHWAREHDDEARKIAENGQKFILEKASPRMVYCYYYRVLEEYTKRQNGTPRVHDGMEHVPQPESKCPCPHVGHKDEL